jgi:hypothetical protein
MYCLSPKETTDTFMRSKRSDRRCRSFSRSAVEGSGWAAPQPRSVQSRLLRSIGTDTTQQVHFSRPFGT